MDKRQILKDVERVTGYALRCKNPFEHIEVGPDGFLHVCCPALLNYYSIGNIFEQSFEEIWFGDKAREMRRSIIEGDYQYCNIDSCIRATNLTLNARHIFTDDKWEEIINVKYPKEVSFNIDYTCNVRCIMCRDNFRVLRDCVSGYDKIIDKELVPMLVNAENVIINGAGEIFASDVCKKLVKKIAENYPKILFDINTNGLMADEKHLEMLNITDKINAIFVSVHASTKETYEKIVRGGDFDKLKKNIDYLVGLRNRGLINNVYLAFVVSVYNYKELIDFQKYANELKVPTRIWEYRMWGQAEMDKHYEETAVFEPWHPKYNEFKKIINDEIFNNSDCSINAKLKPL